MGRDRHHHHGSSSYLDLVGQEAKAYDHLSGLVNLLQDAHGLGEQYGGVGAAIFRHRGTEVLLIPGT